MLDHFLKYKNDLYTIFDKTLRYPSSLDVNLSALQAVSNFLQIAEEKDTKDFVNLLPQMVGIVIKAL